MELIERIRLASSFLPNGGSYGVGPFERGCRQDEARQLSKLIQAS